jgi:arylsulfatase A-like enzyme
MLRSGRHKYCYNPADIDELYDLDADPDELSNLAADPSSRELIETYRSELHAVMRSMGETCIETCSYGVGPNRRITGRWDE